MSVELNTSQVMDIEAVLKVFEYSDKIWRDKFGYF